jgi:translation initiation factor 3 subunit C
MDFHNRQVFRGPPESSKEAIVASAQAIQIGDWQSAQKHILKLNVWRYVPDFKEKVAPVIKQYAYSFLFEKKTENCSRQIREQTLKTYLFTYSGYYGALSLDRLVDMFQLSR